MKDYTNIFFKQYKVMNLRKNKNFKVPYSKCVLKSGDSEHDSDLDNVVDLVDKKMDESKKP